MKEAIKIIQDKIILPRMSDLSISRYKLAQATEISESQLSLWFAGKSDLTMTKFFKILQVLQIQPFYEYSDQSKSEYQLSVNNNYGFDWLCWDKKNLLVVEWRNRKFNDTQKVTFIEEDPDASTASNIIRKMGDWLFLHHKEKIQ